MSVLHAFAESFKAKRVRIRRWYEDDIGRYAFRVVVDDTTFICTARKSQRYDGKISIFTKIARIARFNDAYVLVRIKDDMLVFDPVTIVANGRDSSADSPTRARRGEKWIEFETKWGVPFDDFVDGHERPPKPSGLDAFK